MHPSVELPFKYARVCNGAKFAKLNSENALRVDKVCRSRSASPTFSTECNMSITSSTFASDDLNEAIFDEDECEDADTVHSELDLSIMNKFDDCGFEDGLQLSISPMRNAGFKSEPLIGCYMCASPVTSFEQVTDDGHLLLNNTPSPLPSRGHGDDEHINETVKQSFDLEKEWKEEVGCCSFDETGDMCCLPIPAIMLEVPCLEMKKDMSCFSLGSAFSGLGQTISQPLARMQTM